MRSPDTTTEAAARLARIADLEEQRIADLVREARPPELATVRAIAARQQADALAFARGGQL